MAQRVKWGMKHHGDSEHGKHLQRQHSEGLGKSSRILAREGGVGGGQVHFRLRQHESRPERENTQDAIVENEP